MLYILFWVVETEAQNSLNWTFKFCEFYCMYIVSQLKNIHIHVDFQFLSWHVNAWKSLLSSSQPEKRGTESQGKTTRESVSQANPCPKLERQMDTEPPLTARRSCSGAWSEHVWGDWGSLRVKNSGVPGLGKATLWWLFLLGPPSLSGRAEKNEPTSFHSLEQDPALKENHFARPEGKDK